MTIDELHDKAIGVATVTPLSDGPAVLHGATVSLPGHSYLTTYATVQDADQRAGSRSTLCLLIPVDRDGNVL